MAIQDFQAGYAIGNDLGSAVGRGIAEWKKIQKDKQQKREFEGRVGVYNQRIMSIEQAMMATDDDKILSEYKARQQRYPDAEIEMVPTGGVNKETNAAETEPMIRTPEGDIPVNQVTQIRNRQAQNNVEKIKAQMSALMELQASLPDNPYARQFVAATGANLMTQLNIEFKQQEAELRSQESFLAQRRLELDEREYREEPERQERKAATENAMGMQRDAARIEAEKRASIAVEGVRAQNKPEKDATEFVKKLQQMAPRAQQALDTIETLEQSAPDEVYDRTGVKAGLESMAPTLARSGKRQQYDQAVTQLVNSLLRAESGATITESEIEKAREQYIPKVGESAEVVEQKRQARRTAVGALFEAANLEAPQPGAGAKPRSPEEVRAMFKAGRLTLEQAKAMLKTMGR